MKSFTLSIPSRISNVLGEIAATLPARTWVYVAQLDSCRTTFDICSRLLPASHRSPTNSCFPAAPSKTSA
ncbi:MAG TPA: hypothetical protein PLF81_13150 [Candidatus Anammoximicrobium sp.]|nr:hypothetical protein [Candidatus Anammoximicrobium sp.]